MSITSDHHVEDRIGTPGATFDGFNSSIRSTFIRLIEQEQGGSVNLFYTDVNQDALYEAYLDGFATPIDRQHHNCSCCRQFIKNYGSLAIVSNHGEPWSVFWSGPNLAPYDDSRRRMDLMIARTKITGVFRTGKTVLGTPASGVAPDGEPWTHFSVMLPDAVLRSHSATLTPGQQMAEKAEDYRILREAMAEFKRQHVEQAVTILRAEDLYRGEKVLGAAEFLLKMFDLQAHWRGRTLSNLIWKAVAEAPTGFCKPRGAMIGTLLEDIASGTYTLDAVKSRFAAKMHPLQYQRPQAAPKAGTIAQAEKLVADMGLEPALHRRFARFDEIEKHLLWRPRPAGGGNDGSVFGYLKEDHKAPGTALKSTTIKPITWIKFADSVMPTAEQIQVLMVGYMPFFGMTTATNPEAPPILQWDLPEARNPFAIYFYHGGSMPEAWGIPHREWIDVDGITLRPWTWSPGTFHHHHDTALLIVSKAKDTRMALGGNLCLFPEILKAELHGIRSVIEAHSKRGGITEPERGTANGIAVPDGNVVLRVRTGQIVSTYKIDRWD